MSSASAEQRFAVAPELLRRRVPRGWVRPLAEDELPAVPPRLWGQDAAVDALHALVARARPDRPDHLSVAVPASAGWPAILASVLVERTGGEAPVVVVDRPTRLALRGRSGRPGRLAAAHEGYVVLDAERLADDATAWTAVWECASLGCVEPLPQDDKGAVEQPPTPARASVVLVGTDAALSKLREKERRFSATFGRPTAVEADLPRDARSCRLLAERMRRALVAAGRPEPSAGALRWLLEEADAGSRAGYVAAGTKWAEDLLLEASSGLLRPVDKARVEAAAEAAERRSASREEAHRERLRRGRLRADTRGEAVGVVNALMVYGKGVRSYAVPGRISAQVAMGRQGLVNIEREAKLSGRSYDKGVFLLGGFLQSLFARRAPLSLVATLAFEQSYGSVDGDSATAAEALALLSALAELPCRQGVAVTGGLNQRGELLSVGSLRVKVIGWWRTCRELGAEPGQGVVLPTANIEDLQLPHAMLRDVRAGRFGLWAVDRIEDAIELVMGRPSGLRSGAGFAADSVYGLVDRRLRAMADRLYPPRPRPAPSAASPVETSPPSKQAAAGRETP